MGAMMDGARTAFDVWEQFRTNSKRIYLLTYGYEGKTEALDWSKREGSDIELSVVFPMFMVADYLRRPSGRV